MLCEDEFGQLVDLYEIQLSARVEVFIEESGIMVLAFYALGARLRESAFAAFAVCVPVFQLAYGLYTVLETCYFQFTVTVLRFRKRRKHYLLANHLRAALIPLAVTWFWAVALMDIGTVSTVAIATAVGCLSALCPLMGLLLAVGCAKKM